MRKYIGVKGKIKKYEEREGKRGKKITLCNLDLGSNKELVFKYVGDGSVNLDDEYLICSGKRAEGNRSGWCLLFGKKINEISYDDVSSMLDIIRSRSNHYLVSSDWRSIFSDKKNFCNIERIKCYSSHGNRELCLFIGNKTVVPFDADKLRECLRGKDKIFPICLYDSTYPKGGIYRDDGLNSPREYEATFVDLANAESKDIRIYIHCFNNPLWWLSHTIKHRIFYSNDINCRVGKSEDELREHCSCFEHIEDDGSEFHKCVRDRLNQHFAKHFGLLRHPCHEYFEEAVTFWKKAKTIYMMIERPLVDEDTDSYGHHGIRKAYMWVCEQAEDMGRIGLLYLKGVTYNYNWTDPKPTFHFIPITFYWSGRNDLTSFLNYKVLERMKDRNGEKAIVTNIRAVDEG